MSATIDNEKAIPTSSDDKEHREKITKLSRKKKKTLKRKIKEKEKRSAWNHYSLGRKIKKQFIQIKKYANNTIIKQK